MFRKSTALLAGTTLLLAFAGTCAAQDVYQWTDAQGVTHYAEAPPTKGKYQQRTAKGDREPGKGVNTVTTADADASADIPMPAPKPMPKGKDAGSPQCVTARQNLSLLESKGAVQQDIDGDGKPDKTLDDTERTNQLALARAQLKAQNCGG